MECMNGKPGPGNAHPANAGSGPGIGGELLARRRGVSGGARADGRGGRTAEQIFGSLNAVKVRSCMTLFNRAAPDEAVFRHVLDGFYGGAEVPATDQLVARR